MSGSQADSELGQRWLAALRSGKYRRARGTFRRGSNFCAVGVLFDVVAPERWSPGHGTPGRWCWKGKGCDVLALVGLTATQAAQIIAMSDREGFDAAADLAERLMRGAA